VDEIPRFFTAGAAHPAGQSFLVGGDEAAGQVGEVNQAVEIVQGALEVAQHGAHLAVAVPQPLRHDLVRLADAMDQAMVVALDVGEHVQQFGRCPDAVDQHHRQVPEFA
jgi:hypothetical protein